MAIGNGVSGQFGDCRIGGSQVSETTKWQFTPKSNNFSYNSNKTGGFKTCVAGVKQATGTVEGKYDPTNPLSSQFDVGASVAFKLYLTAVGFYAVQGVIDTLKFMVDIDTGDIVSWVADFTSTGSWTNPGAGETTAAPGPEGFADPENTADAAPAASESEVRKIAAEAATQVFASLKDDLLKEMRDTILSFREALVAREPPTSGSQAA